MTSNALLEWPENPIVQVVARAPANFHLSEHPKRATLRFASRGFHADRPVDWGYLPNSEPHTTSPKPSTKPCREWPFQDLRPHPVGIEAVLERKCPSPNRPALSLEAGAGVPSSF